MAELKNRVRSALGEARMLILGAQVLLGFQFRSVLEKGFEGLPLVSQALKMAGLGLMLLATGLLIAPTAYHRIVERGEDTEDVHRYTSKVMGWALLPLAIALGIDLYVASETVVGRRLGAAAGVVTLAAALFFWYLFGFYVRRERAGAESVRGAAAGGISGVSSEVVEMEEAAATPARKGDGGGADTGDKIEHVLMEARTVLPGAQALLGFQFVAVLTESFGSLPPSSKYVHLASLFMIALTIVLLMTPAAYHRIVERGEETEHFHRLASKFVVAALVPLALGLSGEVYVIVQKVTDAPVPSVVSALVTLAMFWELWFGLTLYRRTQRRFPE